MKTRSTREKHAMRYKNESRLILDTYMTMYIVGAVLNIVAIVSIIINDSLGLISNVILVIGLSLVLAATLILYYDRRKSI